MSEPKAEYSIHPENSGTAITTTNLSLTDLHENLRKRGIEMSYNSLSDFLKNGDISEMLGAKNVRNRKEFPRQAADLLSAFLPRYKAANGRLPQAPQMLRSFLESLSAGQQIAIPDKSRTPEVETGRTSAEHLARVNGMGASDKILTAQEAADVLGISPGLLRKSVKPYRRFGKSASGDRWRLSDLFREESPDISRTPEIKLLEASPELLENSGNGVE